MIKNLMKLRTGFLLIVMMFLTLTMVGKTTSTISEKSETKSSVCESMHLDLVSVEVFKEFNLNDFELLVNFNSLKIQENYVDISYILIIEKLNLKFKTSKKEKLDIFNKPRDVLTYSFNKYINKSTATFYKKPRDGVLS